MAELADERRESFLRWMKAMGLNAHRIHMETGVPKMTVNDYVTGKTKSLRGDTEALIATYYGYAASAIFGANDPGAQETNHVGAWRRQRGLTVQQLAEKVGTTPAIQQLVEEGALPLIGKRRRNLADALGIPEGILLIDPEAAENRFIIAAVNMTPEQRTLAEQPLPKTGTER